MTDPVSPTPSLPQRLALVVDEEPTVRDLVCDFLRMGGFAALSAGTAEEALELAAGHQGDIHLLLADVGFRELTGVELARRLVDARPALRVLLIAGEAQE